MTKRDWMTAAEVRGRLQISPTPPTTTDRLKELDGARSALYSHLRTLEGDERREDLRLAIEAGVSPTELAKGLGISRGRLYQLTERKP